MRCSKKTTAATRQARCIQASSHTRKMPSISFKSRISWRLRNSSRSASFRANTRSQTPTTVMRQQLALSTTSPPVDRSRLTEIRASVIKRGAKASSRRSSRATSSNRTKTSITMATTTTRYRLRGNQVDKTLASRSRSQRYRRGLLRCRMGA